ncbi:hypothetical protein [Brucella intermedia]|uniref:hypothetical protein n=1 Tax=Brucella intermedia TaxID=94625 RepID=UPI0012D2BDF5|nr:hypothetical protein [Brucella intermedia]WGJ06528.1 hypothetical protein QBQ48_11795 [Brucella intermedia]
MIDDLSICGQDGFKSTTRPGFCHFSVAEILRYPYMRLALHAANQYVVSLFPSRQQAFDAGHNFMWPPFRTTAFSPYILKEFLIHAGNETTRTEEQDTGGAAGFCRNA